MMSIGRLVFSSFRRVLYDKNMKDSVCFARLLAASLLNRLWQFGKCEILK